MAITIIESSPFNQQLTSGSYYSTTLYAIASTDVPSATLTYNWSGNLTKHTGTTSVLYDVKPDTYTLVIADGTSTAASAVFAVQAEEPWYTGIGPAASITLTNPSGVARVAQDVEIQGGIHIYDALNDMLNASSNSQRLKYGQLARVLHDNNSNKTRVKQVIDKTYKFNVKDPQTAVANKKQIIDDAKAASMTDPSNWHTTTIGPGSGAKATAVIANGSVASITVVQGGTGYLNAIGSNATTVALSSNYQTHTGTHATARAVIYNGAITAITVLTPGTGYSSPPIVNILSGTLSKVSSALEGVTPTWNLGTEWIELPFVNCQPDNVTTTVSGGKLSVIFPEAAPAETLWSNPLPPATTVGGLSPSTAASMLTGLNAVEILERILYPYQPITVSLSHKTLTNASMPASPMVVKTSLPLLNSKLTVTVGNSNNLIDSNIATYAITVSAEITTNTGTTLYNVGGIRKQDLVNNAATLTVNISDVVGANDQQRVTFRAYATEKTANNTNDRVVLGTLTYDWDYYKIWLRDVNDNVSGTLDYTVYTTKALGSTYSGSYSFVAPDSTPRYLYIFLPSTLASQPTTIGVNERVSFETAGNGSLVHHNATVMYGSDAITYYGYRSYFPTAAAITLAL